MVNWKQIDTVLLDMDGTLLDLNFDNHFWKAYVPQKYAGLHDLSLEAAKQALQPRFKSMEGTLKWYCLDYWSAELKLDIVGLKTEIAELIAVLPHVMDFLETIRSAPQQVLLVTNAHRGSLDLKMRKTCLEVFFDGIISSHDYGYPKEQQGFWQQLHNTQGFDRQRTLLVDDSLPVLDAAKQFGIAHLLAVSQPDSGLPKRDIIHYPAIDDFRVLMDGL
jgi:putative hydrolase of the HAD superfamily